jgi:uncharacterized damage-inducible protein DinB
MNRCKIIHPHISGFLSASSFDYLHICIFEHLHIYYFSELPKNKLAFLHLFFYFPVFSNFPDFIVPITIGIPIFGAKKTPIMKKLSLVFTLLLMVTGSSVFAQFTQSQMVAEWRRAKDYTKEYLDAMPEDGYGFKPSPEIRSFAQQMLHLADGNYFFISAASGKPSPIGQTSAEKVVAPTKDATTKAVMDSYDFVINTLIMMTEDQMDDLAKVEGKELTRSGIFGKAFEHQTHHRGQTTIYLRLRGIVPPGEMLF